MRSRRWRWVSVFVALPALAAADPCDDAVRDGVALRREGRDAEALTLFRGAVERCPQPRVRVQLAWAEQAVGRWVDAERDLRGALARRDDGWVESRRPRLEADLARIREHLGELQVTGGVEGAELRIDGALVATLPLTEPVYAVAGTARVELRRPGYYTVRRDVVIAAGAVAREEVPMRPEPTEAPVVTPVVAPVVAPAVAPVVAPVVAPRIAPPLRPRVDPTWRAVAWTATITASALAASTVAALIVRQVRYDDFQRDAGCFVDLGSGLPVGGAGCVSAHDDAQTASTTAIVTGVAAAVVATGAVVAWVRARRDPSQESVAWACLPSLGGAACALRF